MDSELSHSVIGSYLNPPEKMYPPSFIKNETSQIGHPVNLEVTTPKVINSPNNQGNISIKLYRQSGAGHVMNQSLLLLQRREDDYALNIHRPINHVSAAVL